MNAKDIMTPRVISVGPDDTISRAIHLMLQNRISGLPVIDTRGRLVGMVTEGDFLRRAETTTQHKRPRWLELLVGPGRLANEYVHTHGRKIAEIMSSEPVTVSEQASLDEVVALMEKRRIKRVPVVRGENVVGMISRANLLHALARVVGEVAPTTSDDKSIRERILAELGKEKWAPAGMINVVVRDGVVDLWGTIMDERERQALIVAAENVSGVKKVNDHVAWIEPMSGMFFGPAGEVQEMSRAG